ncbi:MAG: VOC family protein [Phenylobacterium sp.]|jgi:catechol 2,3-dioxygenase-like lactoylglutathione lyase family enzyme|uniref:VOC family protein n=1 Tax=Phenylobacterium sp. TaxID=1871053 RepID=UPI001B4D49B4|nr:VOC family protein [Phenylobacterium sp.]MBP7650541.1 VOC family protein [Phenylobacterium sp.]MBP7815686.1 VOC family protein [Phenylobacterium sp.]MBP9232692.1 VOC family protein [Phenylobacterium sp.]MBP9756598.1 VOC family protein [Phenylobacterium sp.]
MSIGYVTIGALDVAAALPFYDAVLGAIGYHRAFVDGGWAGYGPKDGEANTFICPPFDGEAARPGNGIMVAFLAPSKEAVHAAHAAALANGGVDEGAPGPRPADSTSFYGAYVRDLTGNKLCIFTKP